MAERRLSMVDAQTRARAPDGRDAKAGAARRRARVLATCAVLAIGLHAAFLDGVSGWTVRRTEAAPAPLSVRTIAAERAIATEPALPATGVDPPLPVVATIEPLRVPPPRRPAAIERKRSTAAEKTSSAAPEASAGSSGSDVGVSQVRPTATQEDAAANAGAAAGPALVAVAAATQPATEGVASGTLPGADGRPPPVYRTLLPPKATLHYQVRRGFLRGDGQIRWQPSGDAYRLVLEASVAGLTLLVQTSEGAVDGNGLAPVRFLDQRLRRAAQAANFVRERRRITFSGTTVEWPLVAGCQDRLSWMIQLAGIVAADPALLREGARITMAVVGARGDAAVWSLRYVGREMVETAHGSVSAEKLVREGESANDTTAEVWLDPQRSYLPAHATLRNASGAPEYELLLDRIEP